MSRLTGSSPSVMTPMRAVRCFRAPESACTGASKTHQRPAAVRSNGLRSTVRDDTGRSSRFHSPSVRRTLRPAYDVAPLRRRHEGGLYRGKGCVTIAVLPRTPGNKVYGGFMVWCNCTGAECRGLVSLNQAIKEITRLQPRP